MTGWRALDDTETIELALRMRSLHWSWRLADVPDLAAEFGWRIERIGPHSVRLDVGFGLASGRIDGLDGQAHHIMQSVTDIDSDEADNVWDAFVRMTRALTEALGAPSTRIPGEYPQVRWAGPQQTLALKAFPSVVNLELVPNEQLALDDEGDALAEAERS
ncbi:DUF6301 family protein [Nocardia vinacea]|uniref:DUF6301 family protein n=1 Tax=Nocardia vinacea TaxID=96468 RepID=UPI00030EE17C|nr:DUF6301 family protein [Nocardia vinacea]